MYAFLFDKKSLALVVLGFCLGALLFFGAGLAVGTHLDRPKDEVKWTLLAQEAKTRPLLPERADPLCVSPPATSPSSTGTSETSGLGSPEPAAPELRSTESPSAPATRRGPASALPLAVGAAPMPGEEAKPVAATESAAPTEAPPPPPAAYSPPTASSPSTASGYVVQVGTFTYSKNAERRREDMEVYGFRAYVQDGLNSNGDPFYAVRIGHYTKLSVAKEVATVIRRQLGLPPDDEREVSVLPLPTEQNDLTAPS